MSTLPEVKRRELGRLLGSQQMADEIIAAAERTEKEALAAGIAYKERKAAAAPFSDAPQYLGNPQTGIGAILKRG